MRSNVTPQHWATERKSPIGEKQTSMVDDRGSGQSLRSPVQGSQA